MSAKKGNEVRWENFYYKKIRANNKKNRIPKGIRLLYRLKELSTKAAP